ncbi:MAG: hypothetical protein IAX21_08715 [Candidatus Bathyarchaeota archaeon]|nr:hypothetical protein [Candidatus Bathyarchaeum tardum]WGM89040.1 MAG: hypothetical protein NUK63_09005 [Candidatus Bathyarchaeum tardum]WNZ28722.1 MAG: hypothetical protein IAX21_08715 [Candidatus Bathyarchaeota archaeon]
MYAVFGGTLISVKTKLAIIAIIYRTSEKRDQIIAATSIQQIRDELKQRYNKDLSERWILDIIKSLGKIVIKQKDPRNRRKTLYRINPSMIENTLITLIKFNNTTRNNNPYFEGILSSMTSEETSKFLAIGHQNTFKTS